MAHGHNRSIEPEFVRIIERYRPVIYKVCYIYAPQRESVDDYFQSVVAALWEAWPRFRGESAVATWVYRVALYTCVGYIRKSSRQLVTIPMTPLFDVADEADDRQERIELLHRMISRLGNTEKALVLLWLEEKTYDEIAAITGLSRSNVAVKLMRAKDKLRKMYNLQNK